MSHLLKYEIYRETRKIMENKNHTDKLMNKQKQQRKMQALQTKEANADKQELY